MWNMQVWFYEHTRRFSSHIKIRFPRIAKWDAVDHGSHYDTYALIARLKEKKVCVAYACVSLGNKLLYVCALIV